MWMIFLKVLFEGDHAAVNRFNGSVLMTKIRNRIDMNAFIGYF